MAAVAPIDIQRRAYFTRAIGYIHTRHAPPRFNSLYSLQRLDRPYQHARAIPFRPAHHVAAMVHTVSKVYVHMPGAFKHRVIASRPPIECMAGFVSLVVRLRLHNPHTNLPTPNFSHQLTTQQPPCRYLGRHIEPCKVVFSHYFHYTLCNGCVVKATQSHYNLEAIQNLKDISSFTNKGNPVALTLLDSLKYNFGSGGWINPLIYAPHKFGH